VRQGQQNRRGRGRNRKSQNPLARSFESNGPDVKIRGTPAHIAEKYLSLARDAQSSGDPVLAENYLQHAEHYTRIIMAYREQMGQTPEFVNGNGQRMRGPNEHGESGGDDFGDDEGDDMLDDGFQPPQHQPPQQRPQEARHQGSYEGGGGRHDRPFRRDQGRFRDRSDRSDRNDRGDRNDRNDRNDRGDRDRHAESRPQPQPQDRQAEPVEAAAEPRRRERFQQAPHEQPEFLRRPVRRSRSDSDEGAPPAKEEPSRE
jgi:hypothetical protein